MSALPPPKTIDELKNILNNTLRDSLNVPPQDIANADNDVIAFFKNKYDPTIHNQADLNNISATIKKINEYDNRYKTYIDLCAKYVDSATSFFNGLDALIKSNIIIDRSQYNPAITQKLTTIFNPLKQNITDLRKQPNLGSNLTADETEFNNLLNELSEYFDKLIKELLAYINTTIIDYYTPNIFKKILEMKKTTTNVVSDNLNKMLTTLTQIVNLQEKQFTYILNKKKNNGDNILDDKIEINKLFNELTDALKKYFQESGSSDDHLFSILQKYMKFFRHLPPFQKMAYSPVRLYETVPSK